MKKINKFKNETPVTKTMEPKKGSVGEFIEILKQFPADADFELNGNVRVSGVCDDENLTARITPAGGYTETESVNNEKPCGCCNDECDCEDSKNHVMDTHLYGASYVSDEFMRGFRKVCSDRLTDAGVMNPITPELLFEKDSLYPMQNDTIGEIRHHNLFVTECMTEMYRRQLAAMLEYNTQCLAHFAVATNKCMCEIVDKTVTVKEF